MATLYILYSKSRNRYYIGSTNDFARRIAEHQRGHTPSTAAGAPWDTCLLQDFPDYGTARKAEFKLKRLKNRTFIERIISDGHFDSPG